MSDPENTFPAIPKAPHAPVRAPTPHRPRGAGVRRAVAAVAVAGLVATPAAEAQEPATSTTTTESAPAAATPAPDPAPAAAPETPAAPAGPTVTQPGAALPARPSAARPQPSAIPEVAPAGAQPTDPAGETRPPRSAPSATETRDVRAQARVDAARVRAERQAEAAARRLARAAADAGGDVGGVLGAAVTLPGLAVGRPIPSFLIERFRIPPFLLSIYQAAGVQYGVRWEILAAINEIETDYGRNLNVSSAGAQGWMQFMPATWKQYGVDANDDGHRDPYNPVDAIFATARYLKAAGYEQDVRGAIFAYNHADWYVNSVLARAKLVALLPSELIGSLTGLTEGRFPVAAQASYATRQTQAALTRKGKRRVLTSAGSELRHQLDVLADPGSPVIATQDGRITRIGHSRDLGRYLTLKDVYGNTYTYANLGTIAKTYLTPKKNAKASSGKDHEGETAGDRIAPRVRRAVPPVAPGGPRPEADKAGKEVLRAGHAPAAPAPVAEPAAPIPAHVKAPAVAPGPAATPLDATAAPASWSDAASSAWPAVARATPQPPAPVVAPVAPRVASMGAALVAAPRLAPGTSKIAQTLYSPYQRRLLGGLKRSQVRSRVLRVGSTVVGGTILGRIGESREPHVRFRIRPAGRHTPLIDPTPILDGWRLLDSTAVYRTTGRNALEPEGTSVGRILLESKDRLVRRVLTSPDIELYACGRRDVAAGLVDRRVLATLAFLAQEGLKPTVTSLRCGHGVLTSSGNVSEHTTGSAVDIAAINGIPIQGHQGAGSITETTIRKLLTLQGTMKPHQIISLMSIPGTDNTLSLPDHADHIHVGYRTTPGTTAGGATLGGALRSSDWDRLMARLNVIDNPLVATTPSPDALPAQPGR